MAGYKQYEYNGELLTVNDIAEITKLPVSTIRSRISDGWSIEKVMNTKHKEYACENENASFVGKVLEIVFRHPIPNVSKAMQPLLDTPYITTPLQGCKSKSNAKQYCIINLENGKPLIVYPTEFEIISALDQK